MSIHDHAPSTLGRIDAVDVVALDPSAARRGMHEFMRSRAVLREHRLTGADAEQIAALWRALPSGEQARCHIPPYGLRFWLGGQKLLEASLCWECNNVFGYAAGEKLHFSFDSKAPVSMSLLMQCRHVLPKW